MMTKSALKALAVVVNVLMTSAEVPTDGVAVVIDGLGGGNSIEIIERNNHCNNMNSVPPLPPTPGNIEGPVAEYVDGRIYLCGGSDTDFHAECRSLKIGDGSWVTSGVMSKEREYAASTVVGGKMVVVGGYNNNDGWLNAIEYKEPGTDTWTYDTRYDMPAGVFDHCAVSMDDNKVVVIGGSLYGEPYSASVRALNLDTATWTDLPSLNFGRKSHACLRTYYEGEEGIMVTGGCIEDCRVHINDVAFLPFSTMTWNYDVPPMNEARFGHRMTHVDGYAYVVAGYDTSLKCSAELWDESSHQWIDHLNDLQYCRWVFGLPTYVPKTEITCS